MLRFSSEYNRRISLFNQGVSMIRSKNNFFFLNAGGGNSFHDLSDIRSYFTVFELEPVPELVFRKNSGLPERIQADIQSLFDRAWLEAEATK